MKKLLLSALLLSALHETVSGQCGSVTPVPTNGLIAYYPLNAGQGFDYSGNNNHLSMSPTGLAAASDKYSNNLATECTGTYFGFAPATSAFNLSNELTCSFWFNISGATVSQRIIDKTTVGGSNNYMIDIQNSHIRAIIAGSAITSPTAITYGIWHHVAVVKDAGSVYLYYDGVLDISVANTASFVNNAIPLQLGRDNNGGSNYYGALDEVRIYNTALSATEISDIRNAPFMYVKPDNVKMCSEFNTAAFVVSAGGPGLTYQWQKNGMDIPGATGNTLTIPSFTVADTGSYACSVRSNCYEVISPAAHAELGPETIPTEGLFAYYPFSNGSGADKSGYHHDLLYMNNTGTGAGSDHYLTPNEGLSAGAAAGRANSTSNMDLVNEFSFSGWINATNASTTQRIIDKTAIGGSNNFMIDLLGGHVRAIVAGVVLQASQTLVNGAWYHIAVVEDGVTLKIYINNSLAASIANTGGFNSNALPLVIGQDESFGNTFIGKMDEFRLYNKALTASQVNALFNETHFYGKKEKHFVCGNALTLYAPYGGNGSGFQWYKDGQPVAGGNSQLLSLASTSPADAGIYQCIFEENCIRSLSDTFELIYGTAVLPDSALILNVPHFNQDINDKSESQLTITTPGSLSWTSNAFGTPNTALSNSTTQGFGQIANTSLLDLSNAFTYCTWFKTTAAASSQRIIDKTMPGDNSNYLIDLFNCRVRAIIAGGSFSSTTAIQNNQWYHLAVTYDGTMIKIYINGELDAMLPNTIPFTNNVLLLRFGIDQTSGSAFVGSMYGYRMYKRAITPEEVSILAFVEKPAVITNVLPDVTFCPGASLVNHINTINTGTIQWYHGSNSVPAATSSTITINPAAINDTGNYAAGVLSNSDVCVQTLSNIFVATANDTSILGTITNNNGTLTADQGGAGYTYSWVDASHVPLGVTTQTFTPSTNGTYAVLITDPVCGHSRYSETVTISNVSLHTASSDNACSVYPNPATDVLYLHTSTNKQVHVSVYSIEGKLLQSKILTADERQLSIRELSPGFYSLRVETEGATSYIKFVKQ